MTFLIITRGKDIGLRLSLKEFPTTVGRDQGNSVVVMDEEISRFHFKIKKNGKIFILEDLGSKNGCFVNGDRTLNTVIKNGDKILAGNTEFLFAVSSEVRFESVFYGVSTTRDEKLGIGEVELSEQNEPDRVQSYRIKLSQLINSQSDNVTGIKKIHDLLGDLFLTFEIEEASGVLLKAVGSISNKLSRAAFFLVNQQNSGLLPIATKHFESIHQSFHLSQKALSEVVNRKNGVLLESKNTDQQSLQKHRFVLPVMYESGLTGVVHFECDDTSAPFPRDHLELLQIFLSRSSFYFENLLLKKEIDSWISGTLNSMVAAIDAKDTYTVGHSERVCRYSLAMADALKIKKETKRILMISALCHDIGKIGIPDSILKKAASLTNEEYEEMKQHPSIGADIICHLPNAKQVISGVKYHHEKWDGTGYPEGLEGENIPFFGRIIAVADVFDAMVSGRSYSGFLDEKDAIEKIQKEAELFDPQVIKALIIAWENGTMTQRTSTISKNKDSEG